MLEANSTLTPREIAHILVDTADFLIPKFGQIQNGAGYYFDERVFYLFNEFFFYFSFPLFFILCPQRKNRLDLEILMLEKLFKWLLVFFPENLFKTREFELSVFSSDVNL